MRYRERITERARELGVSDKLGEDFLAAEAVAVKYTEYGRDFLPTFAQTPPVARAYMEAYTTLPPKAVELGLAIRSMRAHESLSRRNILFVTQEALAMERIIKDNGEFTPIFVETRARQEQLKFLAEVATWDHVDLHVIPQTAQLPDFNNVFMLEDAVGNTSAYCENDGGLTPPITDPAELAQYETGIADISRAAFSQAASLALLRNIVQDIEGL